MRSRNQLLGPDARPVALPGGDYDPKKVRRAGPVELPSHIRWSGPPLVYHLDDRRDLLRVYELVLREGTSDDIQEFIDLDQVQEFWEELVLPAGVRQAWARWFRDNRKVLLRC